MFFCFLFFVFFVFLFFVFFFFFLFQKRRQSIVKEKDKSSGFRKVLLHFFLNCANMKNCKSFRGFNYIYIYLETI